ncbi:MAG: VWA domain-containing protein [Spirochaetales bacterium]|nr:VWA domain-containing protein [Spirochaetales bacterium]
MNGIFFSNVGAFFLLWVLPLIVFFHMYAGYQRKKSLMRFADEQMLARINVSVQPGRRKVKLVLLLAAFSFVVVAMARPGWNPQPRKIQRMGRDVVFVIDVSKSMLAEDLAPNRLERAKLAVIDCVERLEGDRVALVAFAGTAAVKCPLTLDYGFFRNMVEDISVYSIARGGTNIGDAIRAVIDNVFDDREKRYKDIILITDGEDHDSYPEDAAKAAGEKGIRLLAFGLGDENTGRRIPVTDENGNRTFLRYTDKNGEEVEVWSKLDADMLRKMVNATPGGKYLNVATGTFDLGEIYLNLVASAEKKELESSTITLYEERFQFFLLLGVVLLCVEELVAIRRGRKKDEAG